MNETVKVSIGQCEHSILKVKFFHQLLPWKKQLYNFHEIYPSPKVKGVKIDLKKILIDYIK